MPKMAVLESYGRGSCQKDMIPARNHDLWSTSTCVSTKRCKSRESAEGSVLAITRSRPRPQRLILCRSMMTEGCYSQGVTEGVYASQGMAPLRDP